MPSITINKRSIYYESAPRVLREDRPNLILIHGAGGTTYTWRYQLERISDLCNVIAIDLPGHGRSEGPGEKEIGSYRAWVQRLVKQLSLTNIILGGHSMGGAIVLDYALSNPEEIKGLVLVGTGARLRVLPEILDKILRDYSQFVEMIGQYAFSPHTPQSIKDEHAEMMLKNDPRTVHGSFIACDRFDVMTRLSEIKISSLILCGEDDRLTPLKYAKYLEQNLGRAKMEAIPKAGHMVMFEQPEEFNRRVKAFLTEE
nr:alpha/beta hydrolase [Desulfobacterales bacterium]